MKIKTKKPDSKWLKLARERGFTLKTGPKKMSALKEMLLEIGGWAVCIPHVESDLKKLLKRGGRFTGKLKMMKGEPCQCHSNSAFCWDENREHCRICTGYALTRDGMWRQHSWIYTHDDVIVETTVRRVAYWGFSMSEDECEQFLFDNM